MEFEGSKASDGSDHGEEKSSEEPRRRKSRMCAVIGVVVAVVCIGLVAVLLATQLAKCDDYYYYNKETGNCMQDECGRRSILNIEGRCQVCEDRTKPST